MYSHIIFFVLFLFLFTGCTEQAREDSAQSLETPPTVITMETPEPPEAVSTFIQIKAIEEAAATTLYSDANAAILQYLAQHSELSNLVDLSAASPVQEADGRLVYPLRGEYDGILPMSLDI